MQRQQQTMTAKNTGNLCPSCGIILTQGPTTGCNDPFGCVTLDEEEEVLFFEEDEDDMGVDELNFDEV